MLTNQFTQQHVDFLKDKWWSRLGSSMAGITNSDSLRFSAFVAAFLDLLLSILLFLGAIIACVTSQFVKFFRLEPPCTYIGCTRSYAHHGNDKQLYCTHAKGGVCHDCFFFNTFAKFSLAHYAFPNDGTSEATFSTDETGETSHCFSEGNISDEVLAAANSGEGSSLKSGEVGCLRSKSRFDLNKAYFVCSDCHAQLSKYRQRHVKPKILHSSEPQQAYSNGLDDTIDNIVGNTYMLHDENTCSERSLDENNVDKDTSKVPSKTSGQVEEALASTCSYLDTACKLDPVIDVEKDSYENADGNPFEGFWDDIETHAEENVNKIFGEGKDDIEEEGCYPESRDNYLSPRLHCQDSSFIHSHKTMKACLSKNTLQSNQHVVRNGTSHIESYDQAASAVPEQNENIKDGNRIAKNCHECGKEEEDLEGWDDYIFECLQCRNEERMELDNYTEISKQKRDLVEAERNTYESCSYRDGNVVYSNKILKNSELLEESKMMEDMQDLFKVSSSEENILKDDLHDLMRMPQLKDSMILESHQAPVHQEHVIVTDHFEDAEKILYQQEAEHQKNSGGVQNAGLETCNSSVETQAPTTDFSNNVYFCDAFDDARSKEATDTESQLHDVMQWEHLKILTTDLSAEIQVESGLLESDRYAGELYVGHPEGTQPDMIFVQGSRDEASSVSQLQSGNRVETEEGHVALTEQQQVVLSISVAVSQEDADLVDVITKKACGTEKPIISFMDEVGQFKIVDINLGQQCNVAASGEFLQVNDVIPSEVLFNGTQAENDNDFKELDSEDGVDDLREALKAERDSLATLYAELEQERNAAAIAAREAMAMISRLQEEKAAMQMESAQYQRMVEEKAIYDQQALTLLKEILLKREKEKYALEKELELYRERLLKKKEEEMEKRTRIRRGNDALTGESKSQVLLLQGIEEQDVAASEQGSNLSFVHQIRHPVYINDDFIARSSKSPSDIDSGVAQANSSLGAIGYLQADEEKERFFKDVLPEIYRLQQGEADVFSTEDLETRSILERLWFLEEQLKELKKNEDMDPFKATSESHQLEGIHESPGSDASRAAGEHVNGFSGDNEMKATTGASPRLPCVRNTDSLEASEYDEDCNLADLPNAWNTSPNKSSYIPCPIEEEDGILKAKISSVYDIYEVQHGSEQSEYNSLEHEGKHLHQPIEDPLGKPDSSPRNILQEASPGPVFVRRELPRPAKGRKLFCSHGAPINGSSRRAECDVCNDDESPHLSDEQSPGSIQQDFRTNSMVLRDKRRMITDKEVQELTERLHVLESERDVLRHTLNNVKKNEAGIDLLQEIVLHLRELKVADSKSLNTEDHLKQLQPLINSLIIGELQTADSNALDTKDHRKQLETLLNSMLEVSTPIKRRRYTAESLHPKQKDAGSE